jgi:hypothetical protein
MRKKNRTESVFIHSARKQAAKKRFSDGCGAAFFNTAPDEIIANQAGG